MTARRHAQARSGASASLVVLVYALIPVAWIVSLSLKQPGDLNDGKFLPDSVDVRQLHDDLRPERASRRALRQLDRHRADQRR